MAAAIPFLGHTAVLVPFVLLLVVYLLGTVLYRLFFHPLAKFPGPKLAASTALYEGYYDVVKGGRYVWRVKEMHEKYGPIVRISPNELHVYDPDFHEKLYSREGKWEKYNVFCNQYGNSESVVFTIGHNLHRMRRVSVNPFFSKQKITQLEPIIRRAIEKLCSRIQDVRETAPDKPIPIRLAFESFGTDVITEYCFNKSYNCLDDPEFNPAYHQMISNSGNIAMLGRHLPWLSNFLNSFPSWLMLKIDPGFGLYVAFREDSIASVKSMEEPKPGASHPTIFHEILASPELPASEKTPWRMGGEAITFVSAGTDTVSNTLHVITWHLLDDRSILARLRDEVKTVQPDPFRPVPLKTLEPLPYLTAVILEGLRLGIGLASRSARIAPDRALTYKDWTIPPGTPVSMTALLIHLNPEIFPDPEAFKPDRWLDPAERQRLDKYMVAFSKGTRICLGFNLAWAELYMMVSTIFTRFDLDMHPECTYEDHVKVDKDLFFPQPKKDAGALKVFVR